MSTLYVTSTDPLAVWTALDRTGYTLDDGAVQRVAAQLCTSGRARFGRFTLTLSTTD